MDGPLELHLRIRIRPGRRHDFLAFLREATPFYESPGGIRIILLQDAADDHRVIEIVRYETREAHDRDQQRVASDPEMRGFLDRWRALLEGPPQVETYRPARP